MVRRQLCALVLCLYVLGCGGGAPLAPAISGDLVCYRGDLEPRLLLTGELEAVEATEITVPRTPSWIVQIQWMVADGAEVKAGDKILEFDNTSFAEDLDEKRNSIHRSRRTLEQQRAEAESALISAGLAVDTARITLEKAKVDSAIPESVLSRRDFLDNQLALERAEVDYAKAKEELRVAELSGETEVKVRLEELEKIRREVETAEQAIDDLVATAPRDGTVVVAEHPYEGRKFKEGDSPWVGLTILRMPDLARMRVIAALADVDDGMISVGVAVRCTLDTYPDLQVAGRIVDLTPIAQEQGRFSLRRAFRVVIDLDQADVHRMRPGMSVKVEVPLDSAEHVLLAPRAALDLASDPARARTAGGGWREIRVGPCSAQSCVIEHGLDEGERLAMVRGSSG